MKTLKLVGVLVVLFAVNTFATTICVSPSGNDSNSGLTWELPLKTIGKGVEIAQRGDTVLVTNGTYVLTKQIVITNEIIVKSVNGAGVTIVDGGYPANTNRCFLMRQNVWGWRKGTIEGFTIRNGHMDTDKGGGVKVEYSGFVKNCIIVNNYSKYTGGGLYYHHMYGYEGAGGVFNCTIVSNTAGNHGGGIEAYDIPGGRVHNCIIYFNSASSNVNYGAAINPFAYCCTTPFTGNANAKNVYEEPQFIDGSYRLSPASPCVNKGVNESWMTNAIDMDGYARISGNIVDIGAYEHNALRYVITITEQPISLNVEVGTIASFNVSASCTDPLTYQWQKDNADLASIRTPGYTIATASLNDTGL